MPSVRAWHDPLIIKEKKGVRNVDYVIKNNRGVYIKLINGRPVTCNKNDKALFERSKARNILNSLPKNLKKMHFIMEAIPDIPPKVIENNNYKVSENVTRWVERFGSCGDILNAARERSNELIGNLYDIDKALMNILHDVEIESSKDLYRGWIVYKAIRENRKKRREIKDEIEIIQDVLKNINPDYVQKERIQKAVDGLFHRKYTYRIIEGSEEKEENI